MMEKSTHEPYKTELFAPLMKNRKGKYLAVLSDTSIDRDNEKISTDCIKRLADDGGYIVALCNHQNDVFMQVAEWENLGVQDIDGHTALIAEAKFYSSNPNAKIIKGMLDEGAKLGVSIGAIVKDYDEIDDMKVYNDLELLEASFVALPSNRHGRAMAIAKSYKYKEELQMNNEIEKKINDAVQKTTAELTEKFEKTITEKDAEITKLKKDVEEAKADEQKAEEAKEAAEAKVEEAEQKAEDAEQKASEAEQKLEEEKKASLEKMKHSMPGIKPEEMTKSMEEGKLPIMRL